MSVDPARGGELQVRLEVREGADPAVLCGYPVEARPDERLRGDLARLGIERLESNSEPEDHAATLCEVMAGLASGRFPAQPDVQKAFFDKHVASWMARMFTDLERARHATFYRPVGALGRLFLEIEIEAFTFAN